MAGRLSRPPAKSMGKAAAGPAKSSATAAKPSGSIRTPSLKRDEVSAFAAKTTKPATPGRQSATAAKP
ncbi:MAG: hypothetical protein N2037_09620, partial [Acidimicrobiales bacterium]|nr:hypothetical protein [Acidimicrobiales bacterium]